MNESVQVLLPPPGLAGVVCALRREVPAGVDVHATVHAHPYASLNVLWLGTVQAAGTSRLPATFVTGPWSAPLATRARGPLASVTLVFEPWLLPAWCAMVPRQLADALLDLDRAPATPLASLAAAWRGAAATALDWAPVRALPMPAPPALAQATLAAQGVSAAAAALGTGRRQYERRFAAAYGLPPARWLRLKRFEAALHGLAAGEGAAAVAARAGYADQAHMTREFAAVAQRAPVRLARALAAGTPGLWALRPAHVANLQDEAAAAR